MIISYLVSALCVAMLSSFIWLYTGGGLLTALLVYTLSGVLMIATIVSAAYVRSRNFED